MQSILETDFPTLTDRIGWNAEIKFIADRAQNCGLPHVIGIHGEWGSGKTSFMRQVQQSLGADLSAEYTVQAGTQNLSNRELQNLRKKVVTVWFDAWRYQNEPTPVVPLLHEMREQMRLAPRVASKLKKMGNIVAYSVLDSMAEIGKLLGTESLPAVEKIEKRAEQYEKDDLSGQVTSNIIRQKLRETIDYLLPEKESRVIIFIDDLDRCNPKTAIKLLESLKIYFNIPKCLFVLGMNERVMVDAIREEISSPFADTSSQTNIQLQSKLNQLRAAHYLEKICNDIYRLPLPSSAVELFSTWIPDFNHRLSLRDACENLACLPPNPRRLKALANQWIRFSQRVPHPEQDPDEQRIWAVRTLIVVYIHQFHRDLWERWHFRPDFWLELKKFCNGELTGQTPEWAQSITLLPGITEIDERSPLIRNKFPNPGEIDNFWIGSLVSKYSDQLVARDFVKLLNIAGSVA